MLSSTITKTTGFLKNIYVFDKILYQAHFVFENCTKQERLKSKHKTTVQSIKIRLAVSDFTDATVLIRVTISPWKKRARGQLNKLAHVPIDRKTNLNLKLRFVC